MKFKILPMCLGIAFFFSCKPTPQKTELLTQLMGTWQLISSTTIDKGQSTFTDYTKNQRMIKIINDTHFAFLRHDLKHNKEGQNNFDGGGGRFTLAGDQYTEFLDYYNDKNWEGKTFVFKIKIQNDTLIQTGIEKVEKAKIDRTITERYFRVKD